MLFRSLREAGVEGLALLLALHASGVRTQRKLGLIANGEEGLPLRALTWRKHAGEKRCLWLPDRLIART